MMKKINENPTNDTFLADWLAGNLSDQELRQNVSDEDFIAYKEIRTSLGTMQTAAPDMDANYAVIREKISEGSRKKPVTRRIYPYAAIAASLLICIGLYQLFVFSNSESTQIGATASLTLSDNSAVTLNANSTVSYPGLFRFNRKLRLDGEAHFDVKKGSTFTVKTPNGNVTVLGTQFNVISNPGFFEVTCFEGRVLVESEGQSTVLGQGEAIRFTESHSEKWVERSSKPTWIGGESSFRNTSFRFVIGQFGNQYDYKISYPQHLNPVKFSGAFPNHDIETALQSICLPLNLKYQISGREIIISE